MFAESVHLLSNDPGAHNGPSALSSSYSTPSPFELLPLELRDRIAFLLSKRDCHSLAQSCRSYQTCAEKVIWRAVNLSLPKFWEYNPIFWSALSPPSEPSTSTSISLRPNSSSSTCRNPAFTSMAMSSLAFSQTHDIERRIINTSSHEYDPTRARDRAAVTEKQETRLLLRSYKLAQRARSVAQALKNRPERRKWIKEIVVELPPVYPDHVDFKWDGDTDGDEFDFEFGAGVEARKSGSPTEVQGQSRQTLSVAEEEVEDPITLYLDRILNNLYIWDQTLSRLLKSLIGDDGAIEVIRLLDSGRFPGLPGLLADRHSVRLFSHSQRQRHNEGVAEQPSPASLDTTPYRFFEHYGIATPLPRLKVLEIPFSLQSHSVTNANSTHISSVFDIVGTSVSHLIFNPPGPASQLMHDSDTDSDTESEIVLLQDMHSESPLSMQTSIAEIDTASDSYSSSSRILLSPSLTLHNLVSIKTNAMSRTALTPLSHLLSASKNLEKLSMSFFDDDRKSRIAQPDSWPDLLATMQREKTLDAFRKLKKLRTLEWIGKIRARWFFERLSEEGFEAVQTLVLSQAVECESETYLENIHIPPFPSLISILIPCRTPGWSRIKRAPGWAKAPPPAGSIASSVIVHLRSALELLGVQFGHVDDFSHRQGYGCSHEYNYDRDHEHIGDQDEAPSNGVSTSVTQKGGILDSSRWCERRVNGVLIRTYLNLGTEEELYHFRRLELLKSKSSVGPDCKGGSSRATDSGYVICTGEKRHSDMRSRKGKAKGKDRDEGEGESRGRNKSENNRDPKSNHAGADEEEDGEEGDHIWVDHTSYRGATVPLPVLKKAYKLGRISMGWSNPGRRLELPNEAWDVLRAWRSTLPDRGDFQGRRVVTRSMGGRGV